MDHAVEARDTPRPLSGRERVMLQPRQRDVSLPLGFLVVRHCVSNGQALPTLIGHRYSGAGYTLINAKGTRWAWRANRARKRRIDPRREPMAKDQKPAEELSEIAKQSIEQAGGAVDIYFDTFKKAVSSYPTGGTESGERLKSYAERNVSTTHEFVKQLSHARDFQEMVRIQTDIHAVLSECIWGTNKKVSPRHIPKQQQIRSRGLLQACLERKRSDNVNNTRNPNRSCA